MPATASATPLTLIAQIQAQQAALELTDRDLCAAVGFEREIVLGLIKAGSMKFPLPKIPALAKELELDPSELLKVALHESDPELSKLIEDVFNPLRLTSTEVHLIKHLRKLRGNTPAAPLVFDGKGVIALVAA